MNKLLFVMLALICWNCTTKDLPDPQSAPQQTTQDANARKSAPVNLTFAKEFAGNGMWKGTVDGDIKGALTTILLNDPGQSSIWHVEFDWIVDAEDEAYSFTARLKGILNTKTGKVVMNGTIIEGWMLGAQVHEEGQLVKPETLSFEGKIRIMPASAN
jgi:hypothetical protein